MINPICYIWNNVKIYITNIIWTQDWENNIVFPVNYGFTKDNSGNKEWNAYLLGINEPIEEYNWYCIAVIQRENSIDDQLIIAPKWQDFTTEQIKKYINFQEKKFKYQIITKDS